MPNLSRTILACCCAALLVGCGSRSINFPYRIDVRQGNYIDQEMVDKLKPGMTMRDVQRIMGSPMITDPFHQDRWDYVYWLKSGGSRQVEQQGLSLYFDEEKLREVKKPIADSADSTSTVGG